MWTEVSNEQKSIKEGFLLDRWQHMDSRAKKHKRGFIIGQVATHDNEQRRSIKHDNEQRRNIKEGL